MADGIPNAGSRHLVPQDDGTADKASISEYDMDGSVSISNPATASSNSIKDFHVKGPTPSAASSFVTTASGVDPPRPAKEGFEWVWFPEGYWAERVFKQAPGTITESTGSASGSVAGIKTPEVSKVWKSWRRRSGKSGSGSGGKEGDSHVEFDPLAGISPLSPISPRPLLANVNVTPPTPSPQSPYLSEEAHVHSLQHPEAHPTPSRASPVSGESEWLAPKHNKPLQPIHAPTIASPEEIKAVATYKPRRILPSLPWKSNSSKRVVTKAEDDRNYETTPNKGSGGSRILFRLSKEYSRRRQKRSSQWRSSLATSSGSETEGKSTKKPSPKVPPHPHNTITPSQTWASQFPGGEATRIHTPPLKEDTADGKPRSLFFDVNSAAIAELASGRGSSASGSTKTLSTTRSSKNNTDSGSIISTRNHKKPPEDSALAAAKRNKEREWWDAPPLPSKKKFNFLAAEAAAAEPRITPAQAVAVNISRRVLSGSDGNGSHSREGQPARSTTPTGTTTPNKRGQAKKETRRRLSRSEGVPVSTLSSLRTGEGLHHLQHRDPGRTRTPTPDPLICHHEDAAPPRKAALFEFDVPEHLPNSPMCPTNPRNPKTNGRGVCVYHGRRKSGQVKSDSCIHDVRGADDDDRWEEEDKSVSSGGGGGSGGSKDNNKDNNRTPTPRLLDHVFTTQF
ncbi:hypothetical protein B0H66DRAFT_622542 [Apodospora peruviana]|uniref:Uncharacterized protein n=1 Tax=Apodospora peruviana TaxID=516989 RepID=A0AAE0I4P9_9PEZI|nr:hypothetical protein B0H66DRAFT_622542 [Apodospora peruviana]